MARNELREWLETAESREVGQEGDRGKSTVHKSGHRIVGILEKKKSDYTDDLPT